ncbi:hypothetical protein DL93DRAFT_1868244 [Clavulina sp. PMI_390]|nr:hypothetical protein DL93DRAFT_1868244 [Clavulina sp. PMI_390]
MDCSNYLQAWICGVDNGIARGLLANAQLMPNHHELRARDLPSDRGDYFLLGWFAYSWFPCVVLASTDKTIDVPKDYIDFGMLFILEVMALSVCAKFGHADTTKCTYFSHKLDSGTLSDSSPTAVYLNQLLQAIYTAFKAQQATEESQSYILTLIDQIGVIHHRLKSRPGISKTLMDNWAETFVWAHVVHPCISVEAVCSNPGCSSIEAPTLQCSRCRLHRYCSRECQRS